MSFFAPTTLLFIVCTSFPMSLMGTNQFLSAYPLEKMTSIQLSKATSHGPNLLHQRLQGGESNSSTSVGGNMKWSTVFLMNTQIASERPSLPPWSPSDVNFGPAFEPR